MRKENVFVVFGRQGNAVGDPRGKVETRLVCAANEEGMREVAKQALPGFVITSVVTLAALEQTAKKVKNVLAGTDITWAVYVQPGLPGSGVS